MKIFFAIENMTDKHLLSSDSYPVYHLKSHMKGHCLSILLETLQLF